jgi:hypothetical protein
MESVSNIIGFVLLLVLGFGLEVIAILILVFSAIYPRRLGIVILLGIVAAVLMFVESFLWLLFIGIASSGGTVTSDNPFILYLKILTGTSILCLLVYFPTAILRFKARSKRKIATQSAA